MEKTSQIINKFAKLFCCRRQWNVFRPRGQTVELQLHERHCSPDVLVPQWCRFKSSGVALWRTEITSKGFQNKTSHDTDNLVGFFLYAAKHTCDAIITALEAHRSALATYFGSKSSVFESKGRNSRSFSFLGVLLICRVSSAFLRTVPASPRGTWRRLPDSTHRRSHLLQSSATFYLMQ